jgi:hypothetical protein
MGLIRNVVIIGLGFLVVKMAQRMLANAQAQQEKVKARVNDSVLRNIPKLKLDPITGVYRPEA